MAMGKRTSEQAPLWVPTTDLPVSPGHPFYTRLNRILDDAGFDRFSEEQCQPFYAAVMGRPSRPPGRYFRLLLLGYFEGLDSERGIAWRAVDSLAIRSFVGLGLDSAAPDHSTMDQPPGAGRSFGKGHLPHEHPGDGMTRVTRVIVDTETRGLAPIS